MAQKVKVVRIRQNLEKVARHSIDFFKDTLEHAPPRGKRKFKMRLAGLQRAVFRINPHLASPK